MLRRKKTGAAAPVKRGRKNMKKRINIGVKVYFLNCPYHTGSL